MKINIALIGCSAIANKTVLPTIKSHPAFNLKMVGSRTEEKGKLFAEKFGCDYGTYEDVLNASNIDAVYLSVPTGLHYEWGKKVLESDKHLLLEKPFTSTFKQSEELIKLADFKNKIAMEGLAYVYHPYFDELLKILDTGIIGKIRLVESSFGFPHLPLSDIRNIPELGGGAILDNLIYPLSASMKIMNSDIINKSYRTFSEANKDVDERGFLRIDTENCCANINYGFGFSYKNNIEIWGDEGSISIERAFTKPVDMPAEISVKKNNREEILVVDAANQFYHMIDFFNRKIKGDDKSLKNQNRDILSRMAIISEMYLNIKNG